MTTKLAEIDAVLTRIERLALDLSADPDGHVRRSAAELRRAFECRGAVEPAVARVREGIVMLRRGNKEGLRRDSLRRSHGVDHLEEVLVGELLPPLRRLGFEV